MNAKNRVDSNYFPCTKLWSIFRVMISRTFPITGCHLSSVSVQRRIASVLICRLWMNKKCHICVSYSCWRKYFHVLLLFKWMSFVRGHWTLALASYSLHRWENGPRSRDLYLIAAGLLITPFLLSYWSIVDKWNREIYSKGESGDQMQIRPQLN